MTKRVRGNAASKVQAKASSTETKSVKINKTDEAINSTFSENALKMMKKRYLYTRPDGSQEMPSEMFHRVSRALAEVEKDYGRDSKFVSQVERDFFGIISSKEFTPAGRTMTNAGTDQTIVANCIVLPIHDTMESIFQTLKDAALLQQAGSGLGFAIDEMRPAMFTTKRTRGTSSGPVAFLEIYNHAFGIIKQQSRHGANMAMMSIEHPDILDFIQSKKIEGSIRNFNISVKVTDAFMKALINKPNEQWFCSWKEQKMKPRKVLRKPNGSVYDVEDVTITASELMNEIVNYAWLNGEPGIVFIDEINRTNPLPGLGKIECSNPCVTGDTLVATEKGFLKIEELARRYSKGGIDILTDDRVPRSIVAPLQNRFLVGSGGSKIQSNLMFSGMLVPAGDRGTALRGISQAFQTGEKEVVRIITKEGYELTATPDHRIFTTNGWVEAKDVLGKEILIQSGEGRFNINTKLLFKSPKEVVGKNNHIYSYNFPSHWSKELGQVLGWLVGDGWLRDKHNEYCVGFTFAKDDAVIMRRLKPILNGWYKNSEREEIKRDNGVYHLDYGSKDFVQFFKNLGVKAVEAGDKEVPAALWEAPRDAVIGFLQGLFTSDGIVRDNPKTNSSWIALTAKNKKLLQGVQLLLLNLGIKSRIFDRHRPARANMFPYTNKAGEEVSYTLDGVLYELGIFGEGREKFKNEIGFLNPLKQSRLENVKFKRFYAQEFIARVVDVVPVGKKIVYDLTEPATHSMICNGLVVHQCGEQFLHPYDNCNLGSINLAEFAKNGRVDWARLQFVTRTATRMLDNVIDRFDFPVVQVTDLARKDRRIGLGIMGFADMLYQLGIGYNTKEGFKMAEKVMAFVNENSHKMSREIAKEKGVFPNWSLSIYGRGTKKDKMRNAALTTIAPTGSISMMLDTSSGCEPNFALAFIKQDKDGAQYPYLNKYFEAELQRRKFSESEIKQIKEEAVKTGSIQHLTNLPADLRKTFVTAMDISGDDHIRAQAAFQKHVDNSISKTINLPNSATREDIKNSYILAWKLKCKSCTVYRDGSRNVQVLNIGSGENIARIDSLGSPVVSAPAEVKKAENVPMNLPVDQGRLSERARPEVLVGRTYRMKTGYGHLYTTINNDENGAPFEVFATIGKSGGFFQEQSEGICRLISLALRSGIKVEEVIKKLKGIRGPMPVMTEKGTILSLPDAIAQILEEHVKAGELKTESVAIENKVPEPALLDSGAVGKASKKAIADYGFMPGCPDCGNALVMSEGCISCKNCGFSRCV